MKPGNIVPQLVNQYGFTSSHDIIKHKTRESYAWIPLSEECLGGLSLHDVLPICFAGASPRESRNHLKTCMCPWHMCVSVVQGWYRCLHVSPSAGCAFRLEERRVGIDKGDSPRYGETEKDSAPTCEPTWFHIIPCHNKTQNKRELRRATPVRRMSTGVDDPRPVDHEGFTGGSPRERRNHLKTCMCP